MYFIFKKYSKNDVEVELTAERVGDLDDATKKWLMELITKNMKKLYEDSDWGWKESSKRYVLDQKQRYTLADFENYMILSTLRKCAIM